MDPTCRGAAKTVVTSRINAPVGKVYTVGGKHVFAGPKVGGRDEGPLVSAIFPGDGVDMNRKTCIALHLTPISPVREMLHVLPHKDVPS